MRYYINFDKTINQLVPHFLGGRRLILYLQALMSPLQTLSNDFSEWAKERRIEASMTSQVFKLEWFLNRKFSKYFKTAQGKIQITNATKQGLPLYYEAAGIGEKAVLYNDPAGPGVTNTPDSNAPKDNVVLYRVSDKSDDYAYSFVVSSPEIKTEIITLDEYLSQLQYWIDIYRTAGKTYKIRIDNNK